MTREYKGSGERLDVILSRGGEITRSRAAALIREGCVKIGGKVETKPAFKPGQGARIVLTLPDLKPARASAQDLPLEILYQDAYLAVVVKPCGMVVHPAAGNDEGTLVNALLFHLDHLSGIGGEMRPGIVHRLDKDTSGLMVVARSRQAQDALAAAIAAREVRREYLALAHRPWSGGAQDVDAPIGRDTHMRLRMAVTQSGRSAQTHFEPLATNAHGCLLRCLLRTGRTHQIRVHLAHLGHPIVADALYGGAPAAGMTRQALHARRLSFVHPISGEHMHFEAPPPADFAAALAAWGMEVESL
ncbi:MAG: RluA family pseudouridine synthase [Ottowia sp.]|nr:RluA family pseudouridine synthase [Ottowia sp.]